MANFAVQGPMHPVVRHRWRDTRESFHHGEVGAPEHLPHARAVNCQKENYGREYIAHH